jgi:hypothetical protein
MKKVLVVLSLLAGCTTSSLPEDPSLVHPKYHIGSCLGLSDAIKANMPAPVIEKYKEVDITIADVGTAYYIVTTSLKQTKQVVARQYGLFADVEESTVEVECAK